MLINSTQYPQAFAEIQQQRNSFAEEAEDFEANTTSGDVDNVNAPSTSSSTITLTPRSKLKHQASEKKKNAEVGYVKMEQSPENGKSLDPDKVNKRRSFISNSSSTENDSSDATSDTG